MADVEDSTQVPETADADVDMAGGEENPVDVEEGAVGGEANDADEEEAKAHVNPQTIFLDYLKSPIVELIVGGASGNPTDSSESTSLTAHQAILTRSPYFASALSELAQGAPLRISLPTESLDAITCFLQYMYTGEYFPRRLPSIPDGLEVDPSLPAIDDTGAQLLKHARVYTLADKLGLPDLKTLAHSKIHRINSSAAGEIAYARYVYGNTTADDLTIRKPVAAFWATRSHVLRHEAGSDFRQMCLEHPQFGFDVLTLVLDQKEKRARGPRGGIYTWRRKRPKKIEAECQHLGCSDEGRKTKFRRLGLNFEGYGLAIPRSHRHPGVISCNTNILERFKGRLGRS